MTIPPASSSTIASLPAVTTPALTDLFMVDQVNAGSPTGYSTRKETAAQLAGLMQNLLGPFSAAGTPLPTATVALRGQLAYVTDATTPTYNGVYVSGGAVTVPVFCDGPNWRTR